MAWDPVCKMEVREDQAASSTEYAGRKYFFCTSVCAEKFKADPTRYVAAPGEIKDRGAA